VIADPDVIRANLRNIICHKWVMESNGAFFLNSFRIRKICPLVTMQWVGIADMGYQGHEESQEKDQDKQ